jgi:hypothetical protein
MHVSLEAAPLGQQLLLDVLVAAKGTTALFFFFLPVTVAPGALSAESTACRRRRPAHVGSVVPSGPVPTQGGQVLAPHSAAAAASSSSHLM